MEKVSKFEIARKRIFGLALVVLFIFFTLSMLNAQWSLVGNVTNLSSFPSTSIVDENISFIGGGPAGTPVLYKSTNGGVNFTSVPVAGITNEIYSIWAVNVNTIYLGCSPQAGGNARVWKTTNGGTNWTNIFSTGGTAGFINGIVFSRVNPLVGIIQSDPPTGPGGAFWLRKTTNGGVNWTTVTVPAVAGNASAQNSVFCIDQNFFGFGLNKSPQIMFTTNGGTNWIRRTLTGAQGPTGFVTSIAFSTDKLNGVGAGYGTSTAISRTTNGGNNWFQQNVPLTNGSTTNYGELKWVPGFTTVYLVCSGATTQSFKSEDNGATWTALTFPTVAGVTHMDLVYSTLLSRGTAVSNTGAIYKIGDSPQPVELTSFTYNVINRNVNLKWSTSMEENNLGFEVYRIQSDLNTQDPNNWVKAGFVRGNGNTNHLSEYNFTDKKLPSGKYNYKIKQIDYNGNFEYYSLNGTVEITTARKFNLAQNYPNPFNPVTNIDYDIPLDSKVTLQVFDITGRMVSELVNAQQKAGYYTVQFNAINLASGNYFYHLTTNSNGTQTSITKRMIVIK